MTREKMQQFGFELGLAVYQADRERYLASLPDYTAEDKVREEIANDGGASWDWDDETTEED